MTITLPAEATSAALLSGRTLQAPRRNQVEARYVASLTYSFKCCVVCGLENPKCLNVAYLDQNASNNEADNLAFLCPTHHWMLDAQLYPLEAIRAMRAHWQVTRGKPNHHARMKDAGQKAARSRKRSAAARRAWATRRSANELTDD